MHVTIRGTDVAATNNKRKQHRLDDTSTPSAAGVDTLLGNRGVSWMVAALKVEVMLHRDPIITHQATFTAFNSYRRGLRREAPQWNPHDRRAV